MFLAYVDESSTPAWYYMAALLVPDHAAIPLTEALDDVVDRAAAAYGIPRDAELHAWNLFHGKTEWASMPAPRARIAVYNNAFTAIADSGAKIVLRGVSIASLQAGPESAHAFVLGHLLEQIDACALEHDELALVIADEVHGQAKHRADLAGYKRTGTAGPAQSQLQRIVDTLHFAPSHTSRLLQAADLIVFLHRRRELHTETDKRSERANETLWARIAPHVTHAGCWPERPRRTKAPHTGGA